MAKAAQKTPRKRAAAKKSTPKSAAALPHRLQDAALALASQKPWREIDMPEIAEAADAPLGDALEIFASKIDLLNGFGRRIGKISLANAPSYDEADSPRDRLFDLLMRRFDALRPYKSGLASVLEDAPRDLAGDPLGALMGGRALIAGMGEVLAAAGLESGGILGRMRAQGLALIYLASLRQWLKDESEDMAKTMSRLDKMLARAEMAARLCGRRPTREPAEMR